MQILVYVTDDKERYLGGDPLTLLIEDARARQELLFPLAKALKASVIQLKNGDHLIVREDSP
jgi:hypothetical protein